MKKNFIRRWSKSFTKVLALLLTAAMVLNSNGITVLAAENADDFSAETYQDAPDESETTDITTEISADIGSESAQENPSETEEFSELTEEIDDTVDIVTAEAAEADIPVETTEETTSSETDDASLSADEADTKDIQNDLSEDISEDSAEILTEDVVEEISEEILTAEYDEDGFEWGGTNGLTITGYNGKSSSVTIPEKTESIGARAFLDQQIITVDFSKAVNLTSIGDNAFTKSSSGQNPVLANVKGIENCTKLTRICESAFANTPIYSINLPSSLNYIEKSAFENCVNLEELVLPEKLSDIGDGAFKGCEKLKILSVNAVSRVGAAVFANCALEKVSFVDGITNIPANLFSSATFAEGANVTIPNTVTEIGEKAFYAAKNLTIVHIKDNMVLAKIGKSAFQGCTELNSVVFPENGKLATIEESAFSGCTAITEVNMPDTITSVGKNAFSGTESLEKVRISQNKEYTELAEGIFSQSKINNLTVIDIPANITTIGAKAFQKNAIEALVLPDTVTEVGDSAFDSNVYMKSLTLSKGMSRINPNVFHDCDSLGPEVNIPDNITYIGANAFNGCNALVTITGANKVTEISTAAFSNCNKLANFVLPDTLVKIGDGAFSETNGSAPVFSEVTIPVNVESIGKMAFASETSLTKIVLKSEKLTSCGDAIFQGCVINEVVFPENLEKIPAKLFYQATFQTGTVLTIPSTVTEIGAYAFAGTEKVNSNIVDIQYTTEGVSAIESIGDYAFAYNGSINFTIPESVTYIGKYAFASNTSDTFTSATIPKGVYYIGDGAFDNCTHLTTVSFKVAETDGKLKGSEITKIADGTFNNCIVLKEIDIPQGVQSIGKNAFHGCTSLVHVYLPSTVATIDATAFTGCNNEALTFATAADTAAYSWLQNNKPATAKLSTEKIYTITYKLNSDEAINSARNSFCYEASDAHAGAADTYLYEPELAGSTFIGWYTDAECTEQIKSTKDQTGNITVYAKWKEVEAIDEMFLWDDDKTTILGLSDTYKDTDYIVIPKECKWIEADAFANNKKIKSIAFEKGSALTTIDKRAFYNCILIRSLDLSLCTNLTTIGDEAFCGCTILEKVNFPNPDGGNYTLGKKAFYGIAISTLTIPEAMQSADNQAFYNCSKLTTINLNSSQFSLKSDSNVSLALFNGCNISKITFGENVTQIPYGVFGLATFDENFVLEVPSNIKSIEAQAFRYAENLSGIDFSNATGLTAIKDYAFQQNMELTKVVLPEKISLLGEYVFEGCKTLETVECNASLAVVGQSAFSGCVSLNSCDISGTAIKAIPANVFNNCKSLTKMTLPKGVTSVSNNAFYSCTSLAELNLGNSLVSIGNGAFSACNKLESVVLPDTLVYMGEGAFLQCANMKTVKFSKNLVVIPNSAFKENLSLTTVVLSASTNSIGDYAFAGCTALTSADLGGCVTKIGASAFYGDTELATVNIGNSLKEIAGAAFYDCIKLKEMPLPATIEKIGDKAFENCKNIKSIEFPEALTSLGKEVFKGATKLETISINSVNLKTCGISIFEDCIIKEVSFADDITIIPANLFSKATFFSLMNFEIPDTVTEIGNYAFAGSGQWGMTHISKISFTENSKLTKIGNYAFSYSSITEFDMPDTVTSIGINIFEGCKNLELAKISAAATSIPEKTFFEDSSLKKVVFKGTKIKTIGKQAFESCTALQTIELPYGITEISDKAFSGCENLKFAYIPKSVTKIADTAFDIVSSDFQIAAAEGSVAEKWASGKGFTVVSDGIHAIEFYVDGKLSSSGSYLDGGENVIFGPITKNGYIFTGWYLDELCTSKAVNSLEDIPAEYLGQLIKLYAGFDLPWESVTYSISFVSNVPSGFNLKNPANISVSADAIVKLYDEKDMVCDQLIFKGWNTSKDGTGKSYAPGEEVKKLATKNNETITLYGMWDMITYKVTYYLNGGTNHAENPLIFTSGDVVNKDIAIKEPTAPGGMKFIGWYDNNGNKVTKISKKTSNDVILYAMFSCVDSFKIKLKLNGPMTSAKSDLAKEAVTGIKVPLKTEAFQLPQNAEIERAGYTFLGWCTKSKRTSKNAKFFEPGAIVSASDFGITKKGKTVTLYAIWSDPIVYNVTYDLAGGEFSYKDAMKASALKTHTAAKTIKLYTPKKLGYKFAGWDDSLTKTVEKYKKSLPKYIGSDVALVAIWTPITYKVNFNGNGGYIGEKKSLTVTDIAYDTNLYDEKMYKAPTVSDLYKDGYTFVEWNTKKDGTGQGYKVGEEIKNLTTKSGKTIKLYAIWK